MSEPQKRPYATHDWQLFQATLVLADLASFLAGPALAAWLAYSPALAADQSARYAQMTLLMAPIYLLIFASQGLYDPRKLLGGAREYAAVFRATVYGLAAIILADFLFRRYLSRQWIVLSAVTITVLVGAVRFALRRAAYRLRRRGRFTTRAIIIGADADGMAVAAKLSEPGSGIEVVGLLDDYVPVGTVLGRGLRVLGTPSALDQLALREQAREAVVVPQAVPWETLQKLVADVALAPDGVRVHLAAGFYDLLSSSVAPADLHGVPLLTVNKARLGGFEAALKLTVDYVLATALLLFFAPVLALTAVWLWLASNGPVVDRRIVLGRGGRPFVQLAFNTGRKPGHFVSKLPGLLNVLTGHLSLVGPRPIPLEEAGNSVEQRVTLTIRPGLTGPWRQVADPADQALLDLYYIRSYSIWLDLQVLLTRVRSRVRPHAAPAAIGGVRVERDKGLAQLTRLL